MEYRTQGLTEQEVLESRRRFGKNLLKDGGRREWHIVFEVLREPMVLLLIAACTFYLLMGEFREGIIMGFAIVLVSGISVYQQVRSENALKSLSAVTRRAVTVIRDAVTLQIESEELVVGDLAIFSEGDQVSADVKIMELSDFSVDESILTGESLPVQDKKTGDLLFSGSTVNSGMAKGEVTAVGNQTRLGKMGKVMEETIKEKTPLQQQVAGFVRLMAFFGLTAFLVVWIFNYMNSGDVMESFMHGLTLAMAVLPEEIPVALATFMALGAYRMIRNKVLARHPQTVEALGAATVICVDKTGTITENRMTVAALYDHKTGELLKEKVSSSSAIELLTLARLSCEEDPFDPMEKAIHLKYEDEISDKDHFEKIYEYPISGAHPMMTHIFLGTRSGRVIAAKGAPEAIMMLSDLNEEEKKRITQVLRQLASGGNRVLAVGRGLLNGDQFPATQQEFRFEFIGLIALHDPPKKNIPEVIRSFYDAGIEVKMITGDYPDTAMSIAAEAGIRNGEKILTGTDLAVMDDDELQKQVNENAIFARVSPEAKLRIINALKARGEVVAMTGDGVNDGPALRAAHIGVAMGKRGSAVARQASSMVLINDDLAGMVKAVASGRGIYANLKKAIQYIISIHIPLISVVTLPILLGWKFPNIFSPVHVIFLELIMGPTCSIVYENEPVDARLMKQKPRKMTDKLFNFRELSRSVIQGFAITLALMILMYYLIYKGENEVHIRTMIFTSLVLSNILLTLTGRSVTDSIFTTLRYPNRLVPLMIAITLLLLLLSLYYSPVMDIFQFGYLSVSDMALCTGTAVAGVIWIEVYKKIRTG